MTTIAKLQSLLALTGAELQDYQNAMQHEYGGGHPKVPSLNVLLNQIDEALSDTEVLNATDLQDRLTAAESEIQVLRGSNARSKSEESIIDLILGGETEFTSMHMDYWNHMHDSIFNLMHERDQLRAQIDAARSGYVKLTNNVSFADNGEAAYVANQSLMDEFDKVFSAAPVPEQAKAVDDIPTFDLDKLAWENIKKAASESKWMPPEYMANDWEYDVCEFLRNGHAQPSPNKADVPNDTVEVLRDLLIDYESVFNDAYCQLELDVNDETYLRAKAIVDSLPPLKDESI
jgi:hypothetical protein